MMSQCKADQKPKYSLKKKQDKYHESQSPKHKYIHFCPLLSLSGKDACPKFKHLNENNFLRRVGNPFYLI